MNQSKIRINQIGFILHINEVRKETNEYRKFQTDKERKRNKQL